MLMITPVAAADASGPAAVRGVPRGVRLGVPRGPLGAERADAQGGPAAAVGAARGVAARDVEAVMMIVGGRRARGAGPGGSRRHRGGGVRGEYAVLGRGGGGGAAGNGGNAAGGPRDAAGRSDPAASPPTLDPGAPPSLVPSPMLTRLDTETLRVTLEPKRNDVCGEPTYCMAGGTLPWGVGGGWWGRRRAWDDAAAGLGGAARGRDGVKRQPTCSLELG